MCLASCEKEGRGALLSKKITHSIWNIFEKNIPVHYENRNKAKCTVTQWFSRAGTRRCLVYAHVLSIWFYLIVIKTAAVNFSRTTAVTPLSIILTEKLMTLSKERDSPPPSFMEPEGSLSWTSDRVLCQMNDDSSRRHTLYPSCWTLALYSHVRTELHVLRPIPWRQFHLSHSCYIPDGGFFCLNDWYRVQTMKLHIKQFS
jgi:hypothetical protein